MFPDFVNFNDIASRNALDVEQADYAKLIDDFVKKYCVGRQYDSCINSPCYYSGGDGCHHPMHPKNAPVTNKATEHLGQ